MPANDDGKIKEFAASTGSSIVSPARFAELRASVANLATLRRDSLARDPQRPDGTTTSEPRAPALDAAAKRSPPDDPPPTPPAPGLSTTPEFYDIAATDERSRIVTEKRHWATLDQYRSLYRYGFYNAVAYLALNEPAAAIEVAASHEAPPSSVDIGVLKAAIVAYGANNQHRRDFFVYLHLKAAGDADAGDKTLAEITRARLLQRRYSDYDSKYLKPKPSKPKPTKTDE
eukprot:jgi/Tetstr1/449568/TSEL_036655.t1